MEFTIQRENLLKELQRLQGVVEKKTTIPSLSNVLIEAKGNRIELTATDLELGIRSSCAAKVGKEGSICVPAKKLLDYTRLLEDGEVAIKPSDISIVQAADSAGLQPAERCSGDTANASCGVLSNWARCEAR